MDDPKQVQELLESYDKPESLSLAEEAPAKTPEEPKPERQRGPDGKFLPKEPEPVTHSRYVTRKAKEFGYSDEEIANTAPETLADTIDRIDQNRERLFRESSVANAAFREDRPPVGTGVKPTVDEFALDLGLSEENCSPEVLGAITKLKDFVVNHVSGIRNDIQGERLTNRVDQAFAGLPAEFHDEYGTGALVDMEDNDPRRYKRNAVVRYLKEHPLGGSLKQAIHAAAKLMSPHLSREVPKEVKPDPKTVNGAPQKRFTQEQWDGMGTQTPTHRAPATTPKGTRRAVQAVDALLRDQERAADGNETTLE